MTIHRNTIVNADCIDFLPRLETRSVNFILTDPPYITRYKSRDGRTVPNDDNDAWLKPAFAEMYRVLARDSYCVSFYGWPHADLFMQAYRAAGFRVVGHFVFPKPSALMTTYPGALGESYPHREQDCGGSKHHHPRRRRV